jgi:hypothetical protein
LSGGGGSALKVSGDRLIPQLPTITVVTPWLTLGVILGVARTAWSSWVCTSMKPGATTRPATSISVTAGRSRGRSGLESAATRPSASARSAGRAGAPVPSTTWPPRRIRS